MIRSPLKWAGSKARIMETLRQHLPTGNRLIEPFVGSASVFLNTDYHSYLLTDINRDLINLLAVAKYAPEELISETRYLFDWLNNEDSYRFIRTHFNLETERVSVSQAASFLYLNRHCYNGLCRYNLSGEFNAPYGKRKKAPYFPEDEIRQFAEKARSAVFLCLDFEETIEMAGTGDVIYCDPPYIPASSTANFTKYHTAGFTPNDHSRMIAVLHSAVARGCRVVVSNADVAADLYQQAGFTVHHITAPRSISCNGEQRQAVGEIIATLGVTA